jgi:hypothetical protein
MAFKSITVLFLIVVAGSAFCANEKPNPFGSWLVIRELDTPSTTSLEGPQSVDALGKVVTYAKHSVAVSGNTYQITRYIHHELSANEFIADFGFDADKIFPAANKIQWTEVELLDKNRNGIERADLLSVDARNLVLDWHGIYFLAKRASKTKE